MTKWSSFIIFRICLRHNSGSKTKSEICCHMCAFLDKRSTQINTIYLLKKDHTVDKENEKCKKEHFFLSFFSCRRRNFLLLFLRTIFERRLVGAWWRFLFLETIIVKKVKSNNKAERILYQRLRWKELFFHVKYILYLQNSSFLETFGRRRIPIPIY